jgi:hypothetical protein
MRDRWPGRRSTFGEMNRIGKFLGIPFDWRRPTFARIKQRWWNPDEPRLVTPKSFGWGYDLNFARVFRRRTSR